MHECDYFRLGGSGGPPPANFEKPTLKPRILRLLGPASVGRGVGGVIGFSQQICTDLKNGQVELQKSLKRADPWHKQKIRGDKEVYRRPYSNFIIIIFILFFLPCNCVCIFFFSGSSPSESESPLSPLDNKI